VTKYVRPPSNRFRSWSTRAAALTLLVASACAPNQGPLMDPFQDCLRCHTGDHARRWTVAGTWRRGVQVKVVDQAGKSVTMTGNDVGNFYTAEALTFPLTVWVDGRLMTSTADHVSPQPLAYGGCNVCHHAETVTVGPEMAPGEPCLSCHGPGGMATVKLSAAGTFPPANQAVDVAGHGTTTNAVGNFFFYASTDPISFAAPQPTSVGGRAMENGAPSGDCNTCHGPGGNAGGGN
jgi:hypothetical protein